MKNYVSTISIVALLCIGCNDHYLYGKDIVYIENDDTGTTSVESIEDTQEGITEPNGPANDTVDIVMPEPSTEPSSEDEPRVDTGEEEIATEPSSEDEPDEDTGYVDEGDPVITIDPYYYGGDFVTDNRGSYADIVYASDFGWTQITSTWDNNSGGYLDEFCGLLPNGYIDCSGNSQIFNYIPFEQYAQVEFGYSSDFLCGIKTDTTIKCFDTDGNIFLLPGSGYVDLTVSDYAWNVLWLRLWLCLRLRYIRQCFLF